MAGFFRPFRQPSYRRLFAAQVLSLIGTGLATVALGLLAYDLAGPRAGEVLGTALFIKMVAYVGVAPVAGSFAARLPRKRMLISLDLIRAAIVLLLPFVTQVWQVYLLIFALQSASAAFTPAFQATIPDILPDESDYTRALSLSRLAYDLEAVASPVLAAALLGFISFHGLFAGTMLGFVASAALVFAADLPGRKPDPSAGEPFLRRVTRGLRIYLATPRLRGLLALNLVAAAGGAVVLVNTVVIVRDGYGGDASDVALALAAFGAGSMAVALVLPRLLDRLANRVVMLAGSAAMIVVLLAGVFSGVADGTGWVGLLLVWAATGAGYSAILTPSGRLLRQSSNDADRPALFAAQFALSHACWMLTYPLAGILGLRAGQGATLAVMAVLAGLGALLALRVWPAADPEQVPHDHPDLPPDHPHLQGGHAHRYQINDLHRHWPKRA